MKNYSVIAKVYGKKSYPAEFTLTAKAGHFGGAAARAYGELKKDQLKGQRVKQVTFHITLIGEIEPHKNG